MKMKCIAADDEPLALEKIKLFISRVPQLELLAAFTDPSEVLPFARQHKPDLLFLDIQMGKSTGIELAENMAERPQIIFTTAYSEYALKAFDLAATDYLLKPFTYDRFKQAVNKAIELNEWQTTTPQANQQFSDYIFVKSGYKLVKIFHADILYMEGMRDFVSINMENSKILTGLTFSELEKILPPVFVRCHKSFMVSLAKIESIEKDRIRIGNKYIPIGDSYKESFYKRL